tara:strand:+ start:265 stop:600 length:336 start_codon:yes stop_codon:yes gene_type:complete
MFDFKSELNPSIIGKVPKQFLNEDGDYNCVKAIIDWTLDFEMRDYGVKDVYIHIIKVTLIFDDDYGTKSYIIDDDTGFEFNSSWCDNFKWLTIYPVAIWVDFDDKKVEVEF